jgi:hypothetical protein
LRREVLTVDPGRCSRMSIWRPVRADHPLRAIRAIVNEALLKPSDDFNAILRAVLRALVLQVFDGIRSESPIIERLDYDLLGMPNASRHAANRAPCRSAEACHPGGRQGYDAEDFVSALRSLNIGLPVAAKVKGCALDGRTTGHGGYKPSQIVRKRMAGPSLRPGCARHGIAASTVLPGSSPSHSPPTIRSGVPNCWPVLTERPTPP